MSFDTNFDHDFDPPAQDPVRALIKALRSPLPQGVEWDFQRVSTCAVGLALRVGILTDDDLREGLGLVIRTKFGLSISAWGNPFSAQEINRIVPLYRVPARDVTPAMGADALER